MKENDVELELNLDEDLPEEEVSKEIEDLTELETNPNVEQNLEPVDNPSKITGFAAADLIGEGGFGILVISLLVAGLIILRIRMNKKRFIIP